MFNIPSFWWLCTKRAATGASSFANDWQWVFGTPALAVIIWAVNRWLGEGAVTLSQDVTGGFIAAAAAFMLTWLVRFFIGLATAPAELYSEQVDQNAQLRVEVSKLLDTNQAIQRLSGLYHQGRKQYDEYDQFDAWQAKMEAWQRDVEQFISDNFSVAELHEFRKSGSGFEYRTKWHWEGIEHAEAWTAKARVSARLDALDDMVRHSSSGFIAPKMRLSELLETSQGGPTKRTGGD